MESDAAAPMYWSSSDPLATRVLWDPAVHEYFGERCYIYLITGRRSDPAGTLSQDLRRLTLSLGITSATAHALFGPYDVLLRFWGTNQARQRFARGLKASAIEVQTIREFTASEVHYGLAPSGSPSAAEIAESLEFIRRLAEAGREEPNSPIAPSDLRQLLDRSLAHMSEPAAGVKFYVFLKAQRADPPPLDYTVQELRQTCKRAGLKSVSIYSGTGFVDLIVKAVAPDFDSLLDIVNDVRVASKALHFDPWSLPVGDYGRATMQETLDAVRGDLGPALETLLTLETDPARTELLRREIGSLDPRQQAALSSLADEMAARTSGADAERTRETIAACIVKSRKDLNRALSFLTSIEDDLRYFLPRFLRRHLGEQWLKTIRSSDFKLGLDDSSAVDRFNNEGPSAWSLGIMMRVLSESYRVFEGAVASDLHSIFAEGWRSNIREIIDLRDDFAHGKLMELVRVHDFAGALGDKLKVIVVASQFQSRLENYIDQM